MTPAPFPIVASWPLPAAALRAPLPAPAQDKPSPEPSPASEAAADLTQYISDVIALRARQRRYTG